MTIRNEMIADHDLVPDEVAERLKDKVAKSPQISEHLSEMDVARMLGEFWIKHPKSRQVDLYAYFYEQGVESKRSK